MKRYTQLTIAGVAIGIILVLAGCGNANNTTGRVARTLPVTNIGGYLQFHMVSNNVGWTIESLPLGYSKVLRTVDGGKTWTNASPYTTMLPIMASDFMTEKRAWIVVSIGDSGGGMSARSPIKVYFTNDGGAHWTRTYIAGTSMMYDTPISIDFVSPYDGWLLLGTRGRFNVSLYRTIDGGRHWTRALGDKAEAIPFTYEKMGMTFISKTKGFISGLGSATALYETNDAGRRWTRVVIPTRNDMTFDFARPPVFFNQLDGMMEVQYLPGTDGKIAETEYLATRDGGKTWRDIARKSYNIRFGGGFGEILDSRHVYLAAGGTAYALDTAQTSWQSFNVHFKSTPNYVDFVTPKIGWAFNLNGTMYRTQNGGTTWIELHATEVDS